MVAERDGNRGRVVKGLFQVYLNVSHPELTLDRLQGACKPPPAGQSVDIHAAETRRAVKACSY